MIVFNLTSIIKHSHWCDLSDIQGNIFRMRILIMKLVIYILVMGSLIGGCSYLNQKVGLPDDNFLEELAEDHIEMETGLRIDLTPESKEN